MPSTRKSPVGALQRHQDKTQRAGNGNPLASTASQLWRRRGAPSGRFVGGGHHP